MILSPEFLGFARAVILWSLVAIVGGVSFGFLAIIIFQKGEREETK